MPRAIIAGGGLAGMAAAAALAEAGIGVELFEARPALGGRASSFTPPDSQDACELIDNCQHILLRCCTNLLDFYRRLGVLDRIRFWDEFHFLEPGGRVSCVRAGVLPAPFHLLGSLLRARFLRPGDKLAVLRGLAAIQREPGGDDLERITMLKWLDRQRQTTGAVQRFWRPVLASAVNEELDRMAAAHGFQVFRLAFLGRRDAWHMGVPQAPLGRLYSPQVWEQFENVKIHLGAPVERVLIEQGAARGVLVSGERREADYYVLAVPFDRIAALLPELELDLKPFEYSPITGIHLWFDRPVTDLPQAALLDRTIQWVFNKAEGRYLVAVVSASRNLLAMSRAEVTALAVRELAEFLPRVSRAGLQRAHVVKEVHATFSARPGLEAFRPASKTRFPNLFLAGDWTRTGWPATMEGAARSGYLAAAALTRAAGAPRQFLLPAI